MVKEGRFRINAKLVKKDLMLGNQWPNIKPTGCQRLVCWDVCHLVLYNVVFIVGIPGEHDLSDPINSEKNTDFF